MIEAKSFAQIHAKHGRHETFELRLPGEPDTLGGELPGELIEKVKGVLCAEKRAVQEARSRNTRIVVWDWLLADVALRDRVVLPGHGPRAGVAAGAPGWTPRRLWLLEREALGEQLSIQATSAATLAYLVYSAAIGFEDAGYPQDASGLVDIANRMAEVVAAADRDFDAYWDEAERQPVPDFDGTDAPTAPAGNAPDPHRLPAVA